ncbi:MAG: D-glycerate dehydrogenase [Prolixibacteraceae bacterium]|jgi:glyoxylate reductase|nr:D-glycerate dehydrogenase [Prolixibacteraceae bacterium]
MTNKKVLLTRRFPEIATQMLKQAGFLVTTRDTEEPMLQDELVAQSKNHDAVLCTLSDKINTDYIWQNAHLDVISQFAVGYDNIDIYEANKQGIPVGYTPDVLTDATADVAFGLMVATSRKMFYLHKSIIAGNWTYFKPNSNLGIELKNKTLGVLGLGRIGTEMAKRCRGAYKMNVIYHNRNRNAEAEKQLDAEYVSFDELLRKSDVLSLHCALNDDTKGLFDHSAFKKMKPTAIFINTSRGLVHNEADLIEALREGEVWGAGLDVTNPEPMKPDNPLLQMENVCVVPHIGSATVETRDEMAKLAAQNIIGFYNKQGMAHIVNPEILK